MTDEQLNAAVPGPHAGLFGIFGPDDAERAAREFNEQVLGSIDAGHWARMAFGERHEVIPLSMGIEPGKTSATMRGTRLVGLGLGVSCPGDGTSGRLAPESSRRGSDQRSFWRGRGNGT